MRRHSKKVSEDTKDNAHRMLRCLKKSLTYWKSYLAKLPDGAVDAQSVGSNASDIAASSAASGSLFLQLPQRGARVVAVVARRLRLRMLAQHFAAQATAPSCGRAGRAGQLRHKRAR